MMDEPRIRLLPVNVANKIAAGEVIERPASALKELVENSLDAGATQIDIAIAEGGRKLVQVRDNGCGMCREDALLSLERQATSKIRDVDDIERISTLGFRGEAIPSIASVSRFSLVTRRESDEAGTQIKVNAGTLAGISETGAPKGTSVEVRDLFCNVPARRKFLRAIATEEAHIKALFTQHALAHPEVGFSLSIDGRKTYQLAQGDSLKERLLSLFGASYADTLAEIPDGPTGGSQVKVSGFVERPSSAVATRREQFIFVNGRPATAAPINYAIREALTRGDSDARPGVVLFITLPPTLVDVNVHPAKREVRFRRPGDVREAVMEAIRGALAPARPAAILESHVAYAPSPSEPPTVNPAPQPDSPSPMPPPAGTDDFVAPFSTPAANATPFQRELPLDERANLPFRLDSITNVLPLSSGFVIMEAPNGMLLLNPKAALERIAYEKALKRGEAVVSQPLVVPETVRLSPADSARISQFKDELEKIGFRLDDLGMDTWKVDAVPQMMGGVSAQRAISVIASDMAEAGAKRGAARWREDVTAAAVARAIARSSRALTAEGARSLVKELSACEIPYVTPRGKPVVIFTSKRELDRRFGL